MYKEIHWTVPAYWQAKKLTVWSGVLFCIEPCEGSACIILDSMHLTILNTIFCCELSYKLIGLTETSIRTYFLLKFEKHLNCLLYPITNKIFGPPCRKSCHTLSIITTLLKGCKEMIIVQNVVIDILTLSLPRSQ